MKGGGGTACLLSNASIHKYSSTGIPKRQKIIAFSPIPRHSRPLLPRPDMSIPECASATTFLGLA